MPRFIPFNRPHLTGREFAHLQEAVSQDHLAGNGPFTGRCQRWLMEQLGARRALLTHSCTGALEMAAILAEAGPGDEIVMPSFTFVSTANAFVLRGATPVFVDVRPDTLNLDERLVEAAITPKTRAIVAVHYGGVGCDMAALTAIARSRNLVLIEDAAQALLARRDGQPLGAVAPLAAVSFHETKNVIAGEGGALLVNDERFVRRAEIIWEKGTDRSRFLRGQVDKYTWQDVGSSFQPSELTAAFLWPQLEDSAMTTASRLAVWNTYHAAFEELERNGVARRPIVPDSCEHNAHLYYLMLANAASRNDVLARLNAAGVNAIFHYVPLHRSAAGRRFGRAPRDLPHTDRVSDSLIRLPLWAGMSAADVEYVVEQVYAVAGQCAV